MSGAAQRGTRLAGNRRDDTHALPAWFGAGACFVGRVLGLAVLRTIAGFAAAAILILYATSS